MSLLGLSGQRLADLVGPVADEGIDVSARGVVDDLFARAAWSCIAEPGDGAAGAVVTSLGAADALRLLSRGGSASRIATLCDEHGLGSVAEAVTAAWSSGHSRWAQRADAAAVVSALEVARSSSVRLTTPLAASWPDRLSDLGVHAPIALWVRRRVPAPAFGRSIALVGARAATGYGEHITLEASSGLVARGFIIVSGAAYGIDGMAHRAALADGGTTVAFLAGGADRPYPAGHSALIARIADTGAVYSEVPCGASPTKWRFLQRNRLIAATAAATIVLEAGARSGSLNTAGHAASLGRPIGAVPGPVTSAASAGCHRLLREYDATCVTTAAEMAELAAPGIGEDDRDESRPAGAETVLRALRRGRSRSVGELAEATGSATHDVQAALGLLSLDGSAVEAADGWRRA